MRLRIKEICDYVSRGATPVYVDEGANKVMNQATFSKGWLDESNIRYTSKVNEGAQIKKGDLLMASTGGGVLGKVFFYDSQDDNFYADSHVTIMRNSNGANLMKYLYYYFYLRYDEINATMVKGSTNQTELQRNYLLAYEIDMPSLKNQQRMVAYLDAKLSEIAHQVSLLTSKRDAYLRLKKSIINNAVTRGLDPNVKMKDSEVEWIGDVPEHWETCRFKDFLELCTTASSDFNKIGLENIESQTGRFVKTDSEFEGNGVAFKKDSIVYGKLRPYLQKVWLAEFAGNAVGDFFVFNAKKNVNSAYMKYVMLSDGFTKEADHSTAGAKMPRVSSNFILAMRFCLPPLHEQRAIAAYLDNQCSKIDTIVANLDKQISKYADLKRALINEVITGLRAV